jgi:hypothetical protein
VAKIDLNPDNYKSTLWGRFAESYYEEREGNEVWRQIIVRQTRNEIGLQDMTSMQGCKVCEDLKMPYKDLWHMHQSLWANPAKGSPLHKFLVSLSEHGNIRLTDPSFLKGHNFQFEEVKMPDWTKKETGEEIRGRTYYYIAAPEGEAEETKVSPPAAANGATKDELPWDAPNGAVAPQSAAGSLELLTTLAKYADGKTANEIKAGLIIRQEAPEIVNDPDLRVKIMNNEAVDELVKMQVLALGEDGKYKYTLA